MTQPNTSRDGAHTLSAALIGPILRVSPLSLTLAEPQKLRRCRVVEDTEAKKEEEGTGGMQQECPKLMPMSYRRQILWDAM